MTTSKTTAAAEEIPQELLDMTAVDDQVVEAEIVDDTTTGTAVEVHDGSRAPIVADDDWSAIDDGDLSPSGTVNIPLYQLNRKADGGFLNEDTGETVREIDAVLLAKVDTRAWWPVAFGKGGDEAPACRSDDGVVPNLDRSPAQQDGWTMPHVKVQDQRGEPPARVCAECPNSQWDGDTPPACSASIEFLAFVPTDQSAGRVARLRFSGMALSKARNYWNSFKLRMPKRPPMAFITRIELEPADTPNGTFLVPQFRRSAEIGFGEARPIIEAREQRQLEWRNAIATDDRAVTGDVEDTGSTGGGYQPEPGEEPF